MFGKFITIVYFMVTCLQGQTKCLNKYCIQGIPNCNTQLQHIYSATWSWHGTSNAGATGSSTPYLPQTHLSKLGGITLAAKLWYTAAFD